LARRGARLLVYGGPYLEADVVRGFVAANPPNEKSILVWFSSGHAPPPFPEENAQPRLFEHRPETGTDWEAAFYRSLTRADGIILMGGGNATLISGHVALGSRMPILAISTFGGGAAKVWASLSPGDDLPTRDEKSLMANWRPGSAPDLIDALFAQRERKRYTDGAPQPELPILAGVLFLVALAIIPAVWGGNKLAVWMLFIIPVLAGGAGAAIRPIVDRQRGTLGLTQAILATVTLGCVAGGIAGVLFVTAQLTANPALATAAELVAYAERSLPYALGIGFVSGLTSEGVFGKLLGLDTVRVTGIGTTASRP
jgi:hypothetical protein